jgi:hypothetical protein
MLPVKATTRQPSGWSAGSPWPTPWCGRLSVTEVADALRAKGAARLVTRLEGDHGPVAALLRQAGFVAAITDADGQSAGMEAARLYLEL